MVSPCQWSTKKSQGYPLANPFRFHGELVFGSREGSRALEIVGENPGTTASSHCNGAGDCPSLFASLREVRSMDEQAVVNCGVST